MGGNSQDKRHETATRLARERGEESADFGRRMIRRYRKAGAHETADEWTEVVRLIEDGPLASLVRHRRMDR